MTLKEKTNGASNIEIATFLLLFFTSWGVMAVKFGQLENQVIEIRAREDRRDVEFFKHQESDNDRFNVWRQENREDHLKLSEKIDLIIEKIHR